MTLAERLRAKNKALTVEELADLLGVAIRTVYKDVEDGRIPFFRVRSSIRFDPHQVADWLEGKMIPPSKSLR
jgi:excisionase family DNA binding protein